MYPLMVTEEQLKLLKSAVNQDINEYEDFIDSLNPDFYSKEVNEAKQNLRGLNELIDLISGLQRFIEWNKNNKEN